jgi:hypothetical protein
MAAGATAAGRVGCEQLRQHVMAAIKIVAQGSFGLLTTGVRTPIRAWFKCAVDIRLATFLFRFLPGLTRVGDIRKG